MTAAGLAGPGCIGWTREEAIPVDFWHVSLTLYVIAVVHELRRGGAL